MSNNESRNTGDELTWIAGSVVLSENPPQQLKFWRKRFGIKQADRRSHMYILGKTGTGKSSLLETLIRQDIVAGRGLALLDPHGDLQGAQRA